jgi:hypothetical protein
MVKEELEKETIKFETNTTEYYNLPITINELTKCINKTKNTAPGPDKIHNEIMRHLPTLTRGMAQGNYHSDTKKTKRSHRSNKL